MIDIIETLTEYLLFIPKEQKDRAKNIVGRKWDTNRTCWVYPKTNQMHGALIAEFGNELPPGRILIPPPPSDNNIAGNNQNFIFPDKTLQPLPPEHITKKKSRHCWGLECNKNEIDTLHGIQDPPYGVICNLCGNSLRQHPFFGERCEYDLGDTKCKNAWMALTKEEKAQVFKKYGFQN